MLTIASSSSNSSPPTPTYVLRGHSSPISSLHFSQSNKYLYSGDTSGFVAQWNLKTFRAERFWKAHGDGILSIREIVTVDGRVRLLTHARDNLVQLFSLNPPTSSSRSLLKAPSPSSPSPTLSPIWTIEVNALNFCQLSLLILPTPRTTNKGKERAVEHAEEEMGFEGLVAVPSLTKDDFVDVFYVPSKKRLHRSIGLDQLSIGSDGKTGSVMALHLFHLPSPSTPSPQLHLLIGFESGLLTLLKFTPTSSFHLPPASSPSSTYFPIEGKMVSESEGWELVWMEKPHKDAIMSISVSSDQRFAVTVGADHRISKYRIFDLNEEESKLPRVHAETSDSPGKSVVRVRGDSKVLATAGWDGEARVYSFKSLKPLAVLSHHRGSLQALEFAKFSHPTKGKTMGEGTDTGKVEDDGNEIKDEAEASDADSDEDEAIGGGERGLLATGGQDMKICLWEVYSPANS